MPYSVLLAPAAVKDLDALDQALKRQIVTDLERCAVSPGDEAAIKKLKGFRPPLYRLRSGDFRILFRIVDDALHVYRVIDRKDLERALRRLRGTCIESMSR